MMKKITDFFAKWGSIIIVCLLVIVYAKSCSVGRSTDKCNKRIDALEQRIAATDSVNAMLLNEINGKCIDKTEMLYLLHTTENTKTLIIEELVDKKQLSLQDLYNNLKDAESRK